MASAVRLVVTRQLSPVAFPSSCTRLAALGPRPNRHIRICSSRSQLRFASGNAGSQAKMALANRLQQAFAKAEGPSFGAWQMLPGANVSRILARSGVDWVMVDCEHGNMDDAAMHDAVPAIAALGVSPIVRIPDLQSWMVKRALDSGAHGILIPLIRTVQEVRDVVATAKFPPQGRRGFGSPFAMQNFSPMPTMTEYLQQANESTLVMVQIETREALEAVEKIAPLVDVLFIGPFDLGNNIGHPILDGTMDPELHEAIARVLEAGRKAGTKCGIFCTSPAQAKHYAEQGFHMLSVATDATILQAVIGDAVTVAQGRDKVPRPGTY